MLTWLLSNSPLFLIPLYIFQISDVFMEIFFLCTFRVIMIMWQKIAQYFTQFGRHSVHCSTCWRVPSYLEGTSFYSIFWNFIFFSFLSSLRLREIVFWGSPTSTHIKSDGVFSVVQKKYLPLRSVLPLNSEINFCENIKLTC